MDCGFSSLVAMVGTTPISLLTAFLLLVRVLLLDLHVPAAVFILASAFCTFGLFGLFCFFYSAVPCDPRGSVGQIHFTQHLQSAITSTTRVIR
jgi:hypothetical protein